MSGPRDEDSDTLVVAMPEVVDQVALARLYGEPLFAMPKDLYIPPEALQVFLEAFEGPLDLLLYLIRKQNFNILDIPIAQLTLQYLKYVDQIRLSNLELAAEYLLMAAMLSEIKSRMLLPQRQGRALLWDKQVDREVQAEFKAARVAQKPYVYQTQAK